MRWVTFFSLFVFFPVLLFGQFYFGKNKIQYSDYRWEVFSTEHFDVFFYDGEKELASFIAAVAESSYREHSIRFRFYPSCRIPLIIYHTPNLFQETNTIPYILPEGVGGFTEYLKGRVVVPYNGSWADMEHTIRHELVHIFQLYYTEKMLDKNNIFYFSWLPLWFIEGQAEHLSEDDRFEMEMFLRSGVLEGGFVPMTSLEEYSGSFLMYKEGEGFLQYLGQRFGEDVVIELVASCWEEKSFYERFEEVFGLPFEKVADDWELYLKHRYFPLTSSGLLPKEWGKMLFTKGLVSSPRVVRSDSAYYVFFKSNHMGYTGIYRLDSPSGRLDVVFKGGRSGKAELLHLFENNFSLSGDSLLVFSAKSQGGDKLNILDTRKDKLILSTRFADIASIRDPTFSHDGKHIVFSGVDFSGFPNLYVYDIENDELFPVTDDIYNEEAPLFLPGDTSLLFIGDNLVGGADGLTSLFRLNLSDSTVLRLAGTEQVTGFDISTDSSILFSAVRDSIPNLFFVSSDSIFSLPRILTAAFSPVFLGKDSLVCVVFSEMNYSLYKRDIPDSLEFLGMIRYLPTDTSFWEPSSVGDSSLALSPVGYKPKFSLDIAQGTMTTDAAMQSGGGIEGMFSDMLGDHRIFFLVYDQAQRWSDILSQFNIMVQYANQKKRPNWGVGAYRLFDYYYNRIEGGFEEENVGLSFSVSYPFTRFSRIAGNTFARYSSRDYYEEKRKGYFISQNISLVYDNSLWWTTGPIDGSRTNLTVGAAMDTKTGNLSSVLLSLDTRRYFRLTRHSCFATRLVGRTSFGDEPERFYMGGTWSFRGYPMYYFYGRNSVLLNAEFRFPLFRRIVLGLPFGDMKLGGINSAIFFDTGNVWEDKFDGLLCTAGVGFRTNLGGYTVLRLDFAWRSDYHRVDPWTYFDIFFGWDF